MSELNLSGSNLFIGGVDTAVPSDSKIVANFTGVIQRVRMSDPNTCNIVNPFNCCNGISFHIYSVQLNKRLVSTETCVSEIR